MKGLNHTKKTILAKIQAKQESGLTAVWLKWDPPVFPLKKIIPCQLASPYHILPSISESHQHQVGGNPLDSLQGPPHQRDGWDREAISQ